MAKSKKKRKKADLAESKKKRKKAAGEQKRSKKQKAKRRVKKEKRDTKRIFFQRHKFSSFFCTSRSRKNSPHFERRLRTQRRLYEDSLRRESAEEREMMSSSETKIARRRIEWKRNPSMKRSPRSPCWYELNVYLFYTCSCAFMCE